MKKVTEQDFLVAAALLGVEVDVIKAVYSVESRGNGFLDDGQVVILFEGHKFWEALKNKGIDPKDHAKGNEDILYPKWTRQFYKGGKAEHTRLQRAVEIDRDAALASASYGLFQIMGFNYKASGFANLQDFINAMMSSEGEQLKAFVNFCKNTHVGGVSLATRLQKKQWADFAFGLQWCSVYKTNKYDTKLEAAYNKYKKTL